MGEAALDRVRLDNPSRDLLLLRLQVLDLDESMRVDRLRELVDESFFLPDMRGGRLGELEGAERLLELRAYAVERGVRIRGDHRTDELERKPDRTRLERRQARRTAERVAEELLVDMNLVAVELCIDGVAAAAEVDEVQQRQVLLELLVRDREPLDELVRRDRRLAAFAARREQVGEQRLQDAEALRRHRAGEALDDGIRLVLRRPRPPASAAGLRARCARRALPRPRGGAARTARAGSRGRPGGGSSAQAGARMRTAVTKTSPSTRLRSPP